MWMENNKKAAHTTAGCLCLAPRSFKNWPHGFWYFFEVKSHFISCGFWTWDPCEARLSSSPADVRVARTLVQWAAMVFKQLVQMTRLDKQIQTGSRSRKQIQIMPSSPARLQVFPEFPLIWCLAKGLDWDVFAQISMNSQRLTNQEKLDELNGPISGLLQDLQALLHTCLVVIVTTRYMFAPMSSGWNSIQGEHLTTQILKNVFFSQALELIQVAFAVNPSLQSVAWTQTVQDQVSGLPPWLQCDLQTGQVGNDLENIGLSSPFSFLALPFIVLEAHDPKTQSLGGPWRQAATCIKAQTKKVQAM